MVRNKINFDDLENNKLVEYIKEKKRSLGKKLVIPAHHYQTQAVVDIADFVGDSYKLAVRSSQMDAKYIVFGGVKFMAEAASAISKNSQKILIPDQEAGCPLADKIVYNQYEKTISNLNIKLKSEILPVVYVNSSITTKQITGKYNGATCTSSSAGKVINYFLRQGKRVFFAPDYNLGINSAEKLGLKNNEIFKVTGDFTTAIKTQDLEKIKLFIWDGFCYVHQKFSIADIKILREQYEDIQVIVHPECAPEVVRNSDFSGSTQQILNFVRKAKEHSKIAIGTEYHFVKRLKNQFPHKTIIPIKNSTCQDMEKIDLRGVAKSLYSIEEFEKFGKELPNEITIPENVKRDAKTALNNMIKIVEE